MRQWFRTITLVALFGTAVSIGVRAINSAPSSAPNAENIQLETVAEGFFRPVGVTHAGDDSGRLFITEQSGRVHILDADGVQLSEPFLDISALISQEATTPGGYTERGLLGLVFAPDYAESGRFYVNYTDLEGTTQIVRYTVSDDPNVADADSADFLIVQEQPYANHNGGALAFGTDGYLYIGLGDGGAAGDPENRAQNLSTWLGKVLRIDVSGETGYTIPEDNPFVSNDGVLPEIWAYGLRNPWRFSFDRANGDFLIGDVGQGEWEEINYQPVDSAGGENYGWRGYEATHVYDAGTSVGSDLVMPIIEYSHATDGQSVTGGYVYRGEAIPELQGYYVYGDFAYGTIWAAEPNDSGAWSTSVLAQPQALVSSFGEDEAGELYVVNYNGSIHRFALAD